MHADGWNWWWMAIVMGVALVGLVVLVTVMVRALTRRPASDPLAILDRRYARGELGDEEYRAKRSALLGDPR